MTTTTIYTVTAQGLNKDGYANSWVVHHGSFGTVEAATAIATAANHDGRHEVRVEAVTTDVDGEETHRETVTEITCGMAS